MWYKEWLLARGKHSMILVLYVFSIILAIIFAPHQIMDGRFWETTSFYQGWFGYSVVFLVGAAVLGGVDAIATEKDNNTLSFLLARPVSRSAIYSKKFFTNAGVMLGMFGAANLIVWGLEQIPRTITFYSVAQIDDCFFQRVNDHEVMAIPTQFTAIIGQVATATFLGLAVLAVTTFVSIFARNTIHALVLSVITILGLSVAYIQASNLFLRTGFYFGNNNSEFKIYNIVVFGLVAVIFFGVGRQIFSRKEF